MYSKETRLELCEMLSNNHNSHGKYTVCTAMIELTRRCNLTCGHCMKGEPENLDISDEVIDSFMSQVGIIYGLSLGGGEITLCPDRFRYVLESAKKHNVVIGRLVVTINAVVKSEEFLEIYREFVDYVAAPKTCLILISMDRYHSHESGFKEKDYNDRKRFYSDHGKNHVEFQNNSASIKRVGRCEHLKINYLRYHEDPEYRAKIREVIQAFTIGDYLPKMKRRIRNNGIHICQLVLTASGKILTTDMISFADSDDPQYNNGHIMESIHDILEREKNDPYMNVIGRFFNIMEDLNTIGLKIDAEKGVMNLGLLFPSMKKVKRMKKEIQAMVEIFQELVNMIPEVKATDYYKEHPKDFEKVIQEAEKFDMSLIQKTLDSFDKI